jgi:hypothetical protein
MRKFLTLSFLAAFAIVGSFVAPNKAEALPAFARQTGLPCFACHYQHIPQLNGFGRNFKLQGMTQSAQETIKDEGLDLPPNLNAAVMIGSQVQLGLQSGITGNNNGNVLLANDASIFLGGRVAGDMGAVVEWTDKGAENWKFVFSHDLGGLQAGAVLYKTAGGGPGYSMDLFNTGSNNNNYGWDFNSSVQSAGSQGMGAQGLHFFAGGSSFFANVGLFAPTGTNTPSDLNANLTALKGNGWNTGLNFSDYLRLAWTPTLGGADCMIGAQMTMGKTIIDKGGLALAIDTATTVVDGQAQFEVGGKPAQVTFAYEMVPANTSDKITGAAVNGLTDATVGTALNASGAFSSGWNIYNEGAKDIGAMSLAYSQNLGKMSGVKASFTSMTNAGGQDGTSVSNIGLGAWYDLAMNVHIALEEMMTTVSPKVGKSVSTSGAGVEFRFLF